jgi:hypothetical protein
MFRKIRFPSLLAVLAFLKTSVSACAVCFGGAGGEWSKGFTWGVAFLILLPFFMMAGFAAWIIVAIRKNARRHAS